MIHEALAGYTVDELLAYMALVLGGLAAGMWLVVILEHLRPRRGRAQPRVEGGQREAESRGGEQARQPQIPGLDVAVSRHIALEILEKLRSGEVKVALRSDKCPGEVVLDLNTMELRCLDDEGTIRKLGEPKARDEVEEWLPK